MAPPTEAVPKTVTRTLSARPALKLRISRSDRRIRRPRRGRRWVMTSMVLAGIWAVVVGSLAFARPLHLGRLPAWDLSAKAHDLIVAAGFGIDQVYLSGQHFTSDADVYDALDLTNVRTFAAFDSAAALSRIERIPWVSTAQLTRVYPSTLDVVIHERSPAFIWTRGETNYLVDAAGRTLGPMPKTAAWKLPRVVGEGAASEAMSMLAALRRSPTIERQYAYGERVAERRWRIVLKNGTMLELAADRETESLQEIADARAVVPALSGTPMIIDVRTAGRIAMRPAGSSGPTASLATPAPTTVAAAMQ
jgi:cell division protein FtsQ